MELARLNVLIGADLSELEKKLKGAAKTLQESGQKMQSVGKTMSAAVTVPLVAIGVASTKMASDAAEAASKFDVVMGPSADRMRKKLEELHKTVPLARHEMIALAAGIQDMIVPMGVAREVGAEMSVQMVKLAGDIGSFSNANPADVLEAMKSALAGSSEPMRAYGVDTREAALQAIALANGLIKDGEAMDMQTRAQAVLLAIQKDSKDAMGDSARTADSAANSFLYFARDVKDLGVKIGDILIPVVTPLVQKLSTALGLFEGLSPTTQKVIVAVAALAAAAGPVILVLGSILTVLPALTAGFGVLWAAITGPVGLVVAAIVGLGVAWSVWGDDVKRIVAETVAAVKAWLVDKFNAIVAGVKEKVEAVTGFFKNMYDAVVGHSWVPDMIDGIRDHFARLQGEMADPTEAMTNYTANLFQRLGDGVADAMTGARFSVHDFVQSALRDLARLAARAAAMKVLGAVLAPLTGGVSLGVAQAISGISGFAASGANVRSGQSWVVGENGPEIFQPGVSGQVRPIDSSGGVNSGDVAAALRARPRPMTPREAAQDDWWVSFFSEVYQIAGARGLRLGGA